MDFPIWQIPAFGGGMFIALIAVVHVYVAHFAVGGGMFLALTEWMGLRTGDPQMLDYVRRHTLFFLLLTMVFGSLTGVGIWFAIAITSPPATLVLIRRFTFGWATEWVFFLGEIVTLLVYHYTFRTMDPKTHNRIGWLYFAFGFMSLFMINGIIGFMLTPGDWIATGDFWDGFFNPSFWPQLFFRFAMSLSIAGIFAFLTSAWVRDDKLRARLTRFAATWVAVPFVVMVPAAWWYFQAVPQPAHGFIGGGNPEIAPYVQALFTVGPLLLLAAVVAALRMPRSFKLGVAWVVLALGLLYIGAFEFIRESGRRPYVITDYMWSTGIPVADAATINDKGFLATAKWVRNKEVTDANRMDAGRELFTHQCLACHSVDGPMHDIRPLTARFPVLGMDSQLTGQGLVKGYMPPFLGTAAERTALAEYVAVGINGHEPGPPSEAVRPDLPTPDIPSFDTDTDEYVLLAWNNLGMHCISDSDPYWVLLPPANDIFAQLVRRGVDGGSPAIVTQGVTLTYKVEQGFENPADHVEFWKHSQSIFGAQPPEGIGLAGKGVNGEMDLDEALGAFDAKLIPVVPYPDDGSFNPYPVFTIEARDKATGKLLATAKTVAPTSTEMGCKNCHGGPWKVDGVAGISDSTAMDVLARHDRDNGTDLLAQAKAGHPKLCQSCHPDPVLGAKGRPGVLNLPAALHGWHANYMKDMGTEACFKCHPASATGPTGCLRGIHADMGLDCTSCHGAMQDHALGLLQAELQAGKPSAAKLMKHLDVVLADSKAAVPPRTPWLNEPDCLNCHKDFRPPETMSTFGQWTKGGAELYRMRRDQAGALMCEACHGSTHAVYPAVDAGYGPDRDNMQPLQYQGVAGPIGAGGNCQVCHKGAGYTPDMAIHHPMGFR